MGGEDEEEEGKGKSVWQEEEMDNHQEVGLTECLDTFLTVDSWRLRAIITDYRTGFHFLYYCTVTAVISKTSLFSGGQTCARTPGF